MNDTTQAQAQAQARHDAAVDELYSEAVHWHLNTGGETIHAKRIPGKWRTIKWITSSVWLIFFFGSYLRWGDRQAVLFDIPHRQFHLFGITILPQDFWMLSLVLLFFAILLAVSTAVAGRVWCGFFCFQTVWTDVFTWIEDKLEGPPQKRRKFDKAPWDISKIRIMAIKHSLWLLIGFLTGVSFVAWFYGSFELWHDIFTFNVESTALGFILLFTAGTYVLAGHLREQACFWLCPYARIQGVMIDRTTAVPTYDFRRGEPRGRVRKGQKEKDQKLGDCVDCKQCIAVCPTGIDIRNGQQEGCIMCALCIDACDAVMEKLGRPKGLIRYVSLDVLEGKEVRPLYKRPRIWVYSAILLAALSGISYGLASLNAIEIKAIHDRQPLYVLQSDGSIQNKYTLKILNKMTQDLDVKLSASGVDGLKLIGAEKPVHAKKGEVTPKVVFVRIPRANLKTDSVPIVFHAEAQTADGHIVSSDRKSVFIGPRQ